MNDEEAIRNLVETWMSATKAGDAATVLDLMTDDAVFLLPGQLPFGKSAFEQASKSQAASSMKFDGQSDVLEIRVLGDWAYTLVKLKVTVTLPDGSPPMVRAGHTLTILRKDAGKWRIARDANLLAPVTQSGDATRE